MAQAFRDRGGPTLAGQALIYPVYLLTRSSMQWFWAHYLGADDATGNPYVCPARAASLADLAPAFVGTCEFDPLRDEGEAYAVSLKDAGVDVTAKRYDGMIHGVFWLLGAVPSAQPLMDDVVHLSSASPTRSRPDVRRRAICPPPYVLL